MTRPTTPAQRARLVAQWQASSLSQAAFARRHHVHPRTFWDWVREVPPLAPGPATAASFVPVQVVADHRDAPRGEAVAIELPHGERLHVLAGTSPAWVAAIVLSLRAPC
jgi:hypothetical protein